MINMIQDQLLYDFVNTTKTKETAQKGLFY